jgi:hypothetical protein
MSIANNSHLADGLTKFELDGDNLVNPQRLSMG